MNCFILIVYLNITLRVYLYTFSYYVIKILTTLNLYNINYQHNLFISAKYK